MIAEFPGLRIDDFRSRPDGPAPELCILSHMHEDHTVGLARKSYYGPTVYCTAATKAMVLNFRTNCGKGPLKYNHLRKEIGGKEILQALDLDRPYELEYAGSILQVTLIDANHCPGAAMVLVQSPHNSGPSVLFTGDVRCERWHLDSLTHNPALFVYSKRLCDGPDRKWLSLYVDDTFLGHVDPFKKYNDNYDGILQLASLLRDYPEDVHFCLADRTTGYEEVLIALAKQLHTKVHMDAYYFSVYKAAAQTSPLAAKLLEVSSTELGPVGSTRLHYCIRNKDCPMREPHAPTAYFKPCNQPNEEEVQLQNMQLPVSDVRQRALRPFEDSECIFLGSDQRYYKDNRTQKYYPLFPWFYFSRHSSFPELQGLRDLFHITTVRSLRGDEIASLMPSSSAPLPPSQRALKRASGQTRDAPAADAARSASMAGVTLPVYKKQGAAKAKRRRMKRQSDDDDTDADESERHEVLQLLNRRSFREESKERWRISVLEKEKQRESSADTQEFDESEEKQSASMPPEMREDSLIILSSIENNSVSLDIAQQSEAVAVGGKEENTVQDHDTSSLPSPPLSPGHDVSSGSSAPKGDTDQKSVFCLKDEHIQESDAHYNNCKKESDEDTVDETPTEDMFLLMLEDQIRNDPCCWFSFTFDFTT